MSKASSEANRTNRAGPHCSGANTGGPGAKAISPRCLLCVSVTRTRSLRIAGTYRVFMFNVHNITIFLFHIILKTIS